MRQWIAIGAWMFCSAVQAADPLDYVIAPDRAVAEHSQADWGDIWWQWAFQFGQGPGPITDATGAWCGMKQSGPVWFLAGTYESTPVRRSCTVPAGRYLFFPVVNYMAAAPRRADLDASTRCAAAHQRVTQATDPALRLVVEIDGVDLPQVQQFRQQSSGCFDLTALVPEAPAVSAAANGYWIMLRPLPSGHHTIRFGAVLPALRQGVIYEINVGNSSNERHPAVGKDAV